MNRKGISFKENDSGWFSLGSSPVLLTTSKLSCTLTARHHEANSSQQWWETASERGDRDSWLGFHSVWVASLGPTHF